MILCQRDLLRRMCHIIGGRLGIRNGRWNLRIHVMFRDGRVKVCLLTHWRGEPKRDGIN
jgi:hypothetical protein